jgi:predicted Zn-dependent protease
MRSEAEVRELLDRARKRTGADEAFLRYAEAESATTRFANNAITQNTATRDANLSLTVTFGRKKGTSRVNAFGDADIGRLVKTAEEAARLSRDDPEYMPPLPPTDFPKIDAWFEGTAGADPVRRAGMAERIVAPGAARNARVAGIVVNRSDVSAIANSKGLFGWHRSTGSRASATATLGDSTGWADAVARDIGRLDPDAVGRIAVEKAEASRTPVELPPGRYTVVLEPAAVAGFVDAMFDKMGARETEEGTTFLSGREKERILGENISIRTDPFHPDHLGAPFEGEGIPAKRIDWVERGVFRNLVYDRFTAAKHGVEPTPAARWIVIEGGTETLEGLIAGVDRGLLVTRFWYIRDVDPMSVLITGMTRDGLFLIEKGKLAGGVKNFRFNESVVRALANVEAMSAPVSARDSETDAMVVPAMRIRDFHMASATLF